MAQFFFEPVLAGDKTRDAIEHDSVSRVLLFDQNRKSMNGGCEPRHFCRKTVANDTDFNSDAGNLSGKIGPQRAYFGAKAGDLGRKICPHEAYFGTKASDLARKIG